MLFDLPAQLRAVDPGFVAEKLPAATPDQLVGHDSHGVMWDVAVGPASDPLRAQHPELLPLYERVFTAQPIADLDQNPMILNLSRTAAGVTARIVATHGPERVSRWPALPSHARVILTVIEQALDRCQSMPPPAVFARCGHALAATLTAGGKRPVHYQIRAQPSTLHLRLFAPLASVELWVVDAVLSAPRLSWEYEPIADRKRSPDNLHLSKYFQVRDPDVTLGFVGARITAEGPPDEPRAPPVPERLKPLIDTLQHTLDGCLGAESSVHSKETR